MQNRSIPNGTLGRCPRAWLGSELGKWQADLRGVRYPHLAYLAAIVACYAETGYSMDLAPPWGHVSELILQFGEGAPLPEVARELSAAALERAVQDERLDPEHRDNCRDMLAALPGLTGSVE